LLLGCSDFRSFSALKVGSSSFLLPASQVRGKRHWMVENNQKLHRRVTLRLSFFKNEMMALGFEKEMLNCGEALSKLLSRNAK
jgi:hypothetical protein